MVTLRNERAVYLIDFHVHPYPRTAPRRSVAQTIEILESLRQQGRGRIYLRPSGALPNFDEYPDGGTRLHGDLDARHAIYLADYHEADDGRSVTFLINVGDPERAAPGYINTEGEVRSPNLEDDEAVGSSAHLTIETEPRPGGFHRAVLERTSHVSRTRVQELLTRLLRIHAEGNADFRYQHPKTDDDTAYRIVPDLQTRASQSLRDDLEQGYLAEVDFVSRKATTAGLDEDPRIRELQHKISVKLEGRPRGQDALDLVSDIRNRIAAEVDDLDEYQVHIRGLEANASASPRFALEHADAADVVYSRAVILSGFEHPLDEECVAQVQMDLVIKMQEALFNEEYWS